jgi:hypothetical protein
MAFTSKCNNNDELDFMKRSSNVNQPLLPLTNLQQENQLTKDQHIIESVTCCAYLFLFITFLVCWAILFWYDTNPYVPLHIKCNATSVINTNETLKELYDSNFYDA